MVTWFPEKRELQRSVIGCRSSWPAEGVGEAVAEEEIAAEKADGTAEIIQETDTPTVRRMGPDLLQGPRTARGMARKRAQGPATLTAVGRKDKAEKARQIRSYWIYFSKC